MLTVDRSTCLFCVATVLATMASAGCGGESYPLAPVSGRVTLNGDPLADAGIAFEPIHHGETINAGPGSYGKTDEDGRFMLRSLHDDDGAVIGKHRVLIRTYRAKEGPNGAIIMISPERLPPRYNLETELTCEVGPDGNEAADFDLTTP